MRINTIIFPLLACLLLSTGCGADRDTSLSPNTALPTDTPSPGTGVITLPEADLALPHDSASISTMQTDTPSNTVLRPITIRIRNTGKSEVFLRRSCDVEVGISPTTGEWHTLSLPACACDCADLACRHVDCAGCPQLTVVPLETGAAVDVSWLPRLSRREFRAIDGADPICANHVTLPPGPYLADIQTFPTLGDAVLGINMQEIVSAFSLQDTSSIIEVDLP